jgi:transposase-like protein
MSTHPKRPITPELSDEIVRRVQGGESYAAIARDLGMVASTVRAVAMEGGTRTTHKAGGESPWRGHRRIWKP